MLGIITEPLSPPPHPPQPLPPQDQEGGLEYLRDLVKQWDLSETVAQALGLGALLALCAVFVIVVRVLILPFVRRAIRNSKFEWDDAFVEHKFFGWLSLLPTGLLVEYGVLALPHVSPAMEGAIQAAASAFVVFCCMMGAGALLGGIEAIYARRPIARSKPIKGYLQIVKIFLYVVGTILMIATLFQQDPWQFLAGVGAMTAVLLLIFKDTILSLVASIQLTSNSMLRVGDWIEMPKFGADGDVIDISLHTVKIRNFDNTVTTLPTYSLVSDSFKNWRGMQESGGRRIKRNIHIDISSIRFLTDDEVTRFGRFAVLADYIADKQTELEADNKARTSDPDLAANVRRLTNIGTLKAYVEHYLRSHPAVHEKMTFLVRQLQPTEHGLPLEIYIFTNTTGWVEYERIQADIMSHILAVVPEFGLRVYQRPAGRDLQALAAAREPDPAAS